MGGAAGPKKLPGVVKNNLWAVKIKIRNTIERLHKIRDPIMSHMVENDYW
jgi:hypothetical protein